MVKKLKVAWSTIADVGHETSQKKGQQALHTYIIANFVPYLLKWPNDLK
jgi:hypothetical protein